MLKVRQAYEPPNRRHRQSKHAKLHTVSLILILLCVAISACFGRGLASPYPIPFLITPDWQGFILKPPAEGANMLTKSVNKHVVILMTLPSPKAVNMHATAAIAYSNVFQNSKRFPKKSIYVVIIIYGPPKAFGLRPEYAYVFRRDSRDSWSVRPIAEDELLKVECALGHCPNH